MKEHPIIFSGPMVRALLERRKRVTRRLNKQWLKVKKGDLLWVRETHYPFIQKVFWFDGSSESQRCCYKEDGGFLVNGAEWKSSVFMPRWASRITLEATEDARLERLGDITEEEAKAEGVIATCPTLETYPLNSYVLEYTALWNCLHGNWCGDTEVVRVAFKVVGVKP